MDLETNEYLKSLAASFALVAATLERIEERLPLSKPCRCEDGWVLSEDRQSTVPCPSCPKGARRL